jgi:hypothetical protein
MDAGGGMRSWNEGRIRQLLAFSHWIENRKKLSRWD